MAEKKKKIPKLFRKGFNENQFNKKILRKIYIKESRELAQRVFEKDAQNNYHLKKDLDKKEFKRVKKLAKSIKRNTGFVARGKLIFLGIVIGVIVLFNIFFKDMLIESAAETGLEAVFNARVEIDGLHFSILEGNISFLHLSVANSEKPMRNLFELGKTEIDINLFELLKGKVIIDNIECQEINWDTERETSGALAGMPLKSSAETEEETKQEAGLLAFNITEDDIAKLLEAEKENIASLNLINEVSADYEDMTKKWSKTVEEQSRAIDDLSQTMDTISALKINDIKDIKEIQSNLEKIEKAYKDLEKLRKQLSETYENFSKDLGKIEKDKEKIFTTIDEDYNKLLSFIEMPNQERINIVSTLAKGYIQQYLTEIYEYVAMAEDSLDQLKPTNEQKEKKKKPQRIVGYDVQFPAFVHPKFWLKNAEFSIGDLGDLEYYRGYVKNVSSEADLIDLPITFLMEQKQKQEEIIMKGEIDNRSKEQNFLSFDLQVNNFPFALEQGLEFLNISQFDCLYRLKMIFALDKKNHTKGTIDISLIQLKFDFSGSDQITQSLKAVLTATDEIKIKVSYTIDDKDQLQLEIVSNLDEIIAQVIARIIQDLTKQIEEQVRSELEKILSEQLDEYHDLYKDFIGLDDDFNGNLLDLNNYKDILDDKKKELEKQFKKIQDQAGDVVEDQLDKIKDKFDFKF